MRRRRFAVVLGSLVGSGPFVSAQTRPTIPRLAVLDWEAHSDARLAPLRQALRELGYVEGETLHVAYFHAAGQSTRAAEYAAEIVRGGVDVIVALATPAAEAAKQATSTIPIVINTADPVGAGLVSNLARPGGNITGISNMMPDLESKRMEALRELLPGLRRVAFLGSSRDPATQGFVRGAQEAAARGGVELTPILITGPEEIDGALAAMARERFGAVIVQALFALSAQASARLADLAARHRIPVVTNFAHFPRAGGLISFGSRPDFGQRAAARYVDRILKGAKPGDLPIEQPTQFELVLNLKTAAALGLTVPQSLLQRADEVIE